METKTFFQLVEDCEDVAALQNAIKIIVDSTKKQTEAWALFEGIKVATSEISEDGTHYNDELARMFLKVAGINDGIAEDATKVYFDEDILSKYPDVNASDWMVLYARMSQNNTSKDAILNACKVFLDNKFDIWADINI